MRAATISDVAALAGVSRTTVSHALTGRRPVSPAAVGAVRAAVEQLGYRPSAVARSLRLKRTHTIALLVPDIANPFYPVVARGLHDATATEGFYTVICSTDGERATEREYLNEMVDRAVDGIMLFPFGVHEEDLTPLLRSGLHLVMAHGGPPDVATDRVFSDDVAGAERATRHLVEAGLRDIVAVAGQEGRGPGDRRLLGFLHAMAAAGLTVGPERVVRCDYTVSGGHQAASELLARRDRPRAVVCANDLIAIGALQAARDAGVEVPADLAVVGFDDIDASSLVTPALTTVLNPAHQIGFHAGRLLMDRLTAGYDGPPRTVSIPTTFIPRASA